MLLGIGEELQDLAVVVDGLVEAVVIPLHHIVHQLLYALTLHAQLQAGRVAFQ